MTRVLHHTAFAVGLATILWVGAGAVGHNPLAVAVTLLVGAFYLMGALELLRFRQATAALVQAVGALSDPLSAPLADPLSGAVSAPPSAPPSTQPPTLATWLETLPASLRQAVRLRVEGERVALPGPALAPYLAGLLVLLGMLGTFLGMVATLNGTGAALDGATSLQAVRAALAEPVRGLGLAFGTSVAGIAASAMLGLMAALCRRDRLHAAQLLDARIATTLRVFSRNHQRDVVVQLLEQQAQGMPLLVDRLQTMLTAMERHNLALHDRLQASQDAFHDKAEAGYTALAASVGHALQHSLAESERIAGATIQPLVAATMAGIARDTTALHGAVARAVQQQLDGMAGSFDASTTALAALWQDALAQHRRTSEATAGDTQRALAAAATTFEQQAASLLGALDDAHARAHSAQAASDAARLAGWTQALAGMANTLQQGWLDTNERAAAQQLQAHDAATRQQQAAHDAATRQQQQAADDAARQQQRICDTLAQTSDALAARLQTQAHDTMTEVARLVQVAADAPRAAAEVIGQLRQQLADSLVRDNGMLEERGRILQTLATQLDAVNHASTEQRAAIDALVAASADVLERVGSRFTQQADAQTEKLAAAAADISGSAAEVASLGDSFGHAVQLFSQSSDQLLQQLQRIEGALGKQLVRSDEQLAYYVAQAREVIDLSILSQQQIVEDLQQLGQRRADRHDLATADNAA